MLLFLFSGTDATHAEHIETIKSRLYVGVRPDGRFVPGELGMGLCEGYDNMGYELSKPNLRAELESDLKRLAPRNRILDFKMLTGFHHLTDLGNFQLKASYFGKALVSLFVLITVNNILN